MKGFISTLYISSTEEFADIFTKGLGVGVFESLCDKLGMMNIYVPTRGRVLDMLHRILY